MQRALLILSFVFLLAGCVASPPLFETPPVLPPIQPLNSNTDQPTVSTTPASKCQSHLIGRVTDGSNRVISQAAVDIVAGALSARATSDVYGWYAFAGLCPATINVTVTAPGQAPRALGDRVVVDGANTIKFDIVLK